MAAQQSGRLARVIATLFTTLVAPTLVTLITTTIKDAPRPDTADPLALNRVIQASEGAAPTVTLLPPTAVEVRPVAVGAPLVWRQVVAYPSPAAARTVSRP